MTDADFGAVGKRLGMDTDGFVAKISSGVPLRRFGLPQEIVGICTYLASDEASFTTGATFVIDGGTSVVSVVGASIRSAIEEGALHKRKKESGTGPRFVKK